jgi:L-alanine-DL-glutamate epimerase-like enolase superfamily enzyme
VATAACLHLDARTTNFILQESFYEYSPAWRFELLERPPRPRDGGYDLPTLPGLSVGEFTPKAARAHPFDPDAFLPMWSDAWRFKL